MMTTFLPLIKIMLALVMVCCSSSFASTLSGSHLASNSSGSKSSQLNGAPSPQPQPPLALKSAVSSGGAYGSHHMCASDEACRAWHGSVCVDNWCVCPVGYLFLDGENNRGLCLLALCANLHDPAFGCRSWPNSYCSNDTCVCWPGFRLVQKNTKCEAIPPEPSSTTKSTTTSTTTSTTSTTMSTAPSTTSTTTSSTSSTASSTTSTASSTGCKTSDCSEASTAASSATSTSEVPSWKVGANILWIIGILVVIFLVAMCIAIVVCCFCCKSDKSKQARYNNKSNAPMAPSKYPPMVAYPTPGSSDYGKRGPILVPNPGTSGFKGSMAVGSKATNSQYPMAPSKNSLVAPTPSGYADPKKKPILASNPGSSLSKCSKGSKAVPSNGSKGPNPQNPI